MTSEGGFSSELGVGQVISKTFDLFRRDFVKYFVIFAIAEVVIGVATVVAYRLVTLPVIPTSPTDLSWLPGYLGAFIGLYAIIEISTLIVLPIAEGTAVKMAADAIRGKPALLGASLRFALSKLVWMWVLGFIVGIIVLLGFVALVVPGIIFAIMLCLALPSLLLEDTGVIDSLGRSRELVSHRWGKTFATFLVLGLIIVVISSVLGLIAAIFGGAGPLVTGLLSGFYEPIIPIGLTVYFFSNLARVSPPPTQAPVGPVPQPGMKFCPNCGTQLMASTMFCSNCGAKQPAQI